MLNLGLMEIRLVSASRLYVESYQITFSAFGRRTFHPLHRTGFSSATLITKFGYWELEFIWLLVIDVWNLYSCLSVLLPTPALS